MTTSAVGRLVAEWRKRGNELARNGEVSVTLYAEGMRLQLCADELEALATAPPEAKPISAWIEQQQQTTPREMATAPPEQAAECFTCEGENGQYLRCVLRRRGARAGQRTQMLKLWR